MDSFGFLIFVCCYVLALLQQVVAPPPPVIEAYKPTSGLTTRLQDINSGFGSMKKLSKMLAKLEHQIDDIDVRRKIMEAQMKARFSFFPSRIGAAFDYTFAAIPSTVYENMKIYSHNGIFLQLFEDGSANGTKDDSSPHSNITIEMVGVNGRSVRMLIKGTKSNAYLTCTKNGKFLAVPKQSNPTVFSTFVPTHRNKQWQQRSASSKVWMNIKCETYNWWLGFRHNYKLKKGRHSRAYHQGSWFMIF